MVEVSCIYQFLYVFKSAGSIVLQFAANKTIIEDNTSSKRALRDRSGDPHGAPESQMTGLLQNHAAHPPTIAVPLIASNALRHSAIVATPPRTLALAPTAARLSGMTQHDDAMIAPKPATSPTAAKPFCAAGLSEEATDGDMFWVGRSVVMTSLSRTITLSCTL